MQIAIQLKMITRITSVLFSLGLVVSVFAQQPFVQSVDLLTAKPGDQIKFYGINFGTNASNIRVSFGGVDATPTAITDQYMEVDLPLGATYDFPQVTNTSIGLSGLYAIPVLPSYGGTFPFQESKLGSQQDFNSESGLYELVTADFDGDGLLDVATANSNANLISLFRNTTVAGAAFTFSKTQFATAVHTQHLVAGDLNGDGKHDIVLSEENSPKLYILKNTSTPGNISFTMTNITLLTSKANQIRIADLDLDGKPDLITTDQSTGRVLINKNTSTLATISMAAVQAVTLPTAAGTDGIAVGDLNGDALPDIAVGEFLSANSNLFILKNASVPGTISFPATQTISIGTTISSVVMGDLDLDGKLDLALSLLLSSNVAVLGNTSTSGTIQFDPAHLFSAGVKPWGLEIGDIDGDGKPDLAAASITQKSLSVLNNNSSSGSFAFQIRTINTTFINRYVRVSDMDNDSRPDLVFTSIDDNNLGLPASKVSVFRNENCIVPQVTPSGPLTICSGFTQRLEASVTSGATYEWLKDGVSLAPPGSNNFLDVTQTGNYTVSLQEGSCSEVSLAVNVTVNNVPPLGAASISPVSPVCLNGNLILAVAADVGATAYNWSGPQGYTGTGASVTRTNFQPEFAGRYDLDVIVGTCVAQQLSVLVEVVSIPDAGVQAEGSDIACSGSTKLLSFFPQVNGYNYQWAEAVAGNIPGANGSTYTASSSGTYFVKVTSVANPSCAAITSASKKIRVVNLPVVDFSFPAQNCSGQTVTFTNASTYDLDPADPVINYLWDFGDGTNTGVETPNHTYGAPGNYSVELTVSYRDESCPASLIKDVAVIQAPVVQITNPDGKTSLCDGNQLVLEVQSGLDSYLWNTGETTSSILIDAAGTYSVEVVQGCTLTDDIIINAEPAPVVTASATPNSTEQGGSVRLSATGLENYHWSPREFIADSLAAVTDAFPEVTTTYTVTGTDLNGCIGSATVEVFVMPENPYNVLRPDVFFSPNQDGINDVWEIENILSFSACRVTIFDEHGVILLDSRPYQNDWDGRSLNGKKMPAGVYFYIIRCDGFNGMKSGTLNLIR